MRSFYGVLFGVSVAVVFYSPLAVVPATLALILLTGRA